MDNRLGIAAVFAVVAGLIAMAVPAAGVQQVGTTLTMSATATARDGIGVGEQPGADGDAVPGTLAGSSSRTRTGTR